jgi:hypothetical protein
MSDQIPATFLLLRSHHLHNDELVDHVGTVSITHHHQIGCIREVINKKSPKVGRLSQPPLTPCRTWDALFGKKNIAYFNSTASETNFNHSF